MRKAFLGALAAAWLGTAGCGSGSTGVGGKVAGEAAAIEGKWYGTLKPVGDLGKAGDELAVLYRNSTVELDLKPDGKFTFGMMGTNIEGSYKREGDKVTLTYESLMGVPLDDPKSPLGFLGETFQQPETGTIQEKGAALFFPARPGQPNEAEITFTRERPQAQPIGPKTVSPEEEKFLGAYVYDPSFQMPKAESAAMAKAQEMLKRMIGGFRLELLADNTFNMTMMLTMKGKWKLEKGLLKLDVREPDMREITGGPAPNIQVRPSEKSGQLHMLNDKTGKVDFAVKREAGG